MRSHGWPQSNRTGLLSEEDVGTHGGTTCEDTGEGSSRREATGEAAVQRLDLSFRPPCVRHKRLLFTAAPLWCLLQQPREAAVGGRGAEDRWDGPLTQAGADGCRCTGRGQRVAAGEGAAARGRSICRLGARRGARAAPCTPWSQSKGRVSPVRGSGSHGWGSSSHPPGSRLARRVACGASAASLVVPELTAVGPAETHLPGLLRCSVPGGAGKDAATWRCALSEQCREMPSAVADRPANAQGSPENARRRAVAPTVQGRRRSRGSQLRRWPPGLWEAPRGPQASGRLPPPTHTRGGHRTVGVCPHSKTLR